MELSNGIIIVSYRLPDTTCVRIIKRYDNNVNVLSVYIPLGTDCHFTTNCVNIWDDFLYHAQINKWERTIEKNWIKCDGTIDSKVHILGKRHPVKRIRKRRLWFYTFRRYLDH